MRRFLAAAMFVATVTPALVLDATPVSARCPEAPIRTSRSVPGGLKVDPCQEVVVTGPPTTSPPTTVPPSDRTDRVVTLGDSYSSGTGIHRNASEYDDHGPATHSFDPSTVLGASTCYRELQTTPGPRIAAERGAESIFVACRGAVISDITNQLSVASIPGTGANTLVTITIGGNDLVTGEGKDWPDLLRKCIFQRKCHKKSENQITNFSQLQTDLTDLYTSIGNTYPDATVRVLGYPRLMQRSPGCSSVTGISRSEADWFDSQVDVMNGRILNAVNSARSVTGADIEFVSVRDRFDDHGACRRPKSQRWINDKVLGQTYVVTINGSTVTHTWVNLPWTAAFSSFHPTQKGYDAYYEALKASI